MSAIGNPINSSTFTVDTFSGNTVTTQFTMSVAPASTASIIVAIGGVVQDPATYTVNGTTLTFSAAPPTGTGNISVRYLGLPAIVGVPGQGTVVTNMLVDNNVTYAKIQQVTAGKVLGRDTSGNGVVQELPIAVDSSGNVTIPKALQVNTGRTVSGGSGGAVLADNGINTDFVSTGRAAAITGGWGTLRVHQAAGYRGLAIVGDTSQTAAYMEVENSAGAVQYRIDASANLQFNSGYGSAATAYGCRAWITWNGSAGTIRASGGVTSLTKNSTGNYAVNFSFTMPDTNYSVSGVSSWVNAAPSTLLGVFNNGGLTTTSCNIIVLTNGSDAATDVLYSYAQFHR